MKKAYNSLKKNPANYIPLTPISFLSRTADIFGEKDAIIYGDKVFNWNQCRERCLRMASSLSKKGIEEGDTVAVLAFNFLGDGTGGGEISGGGDGISNKRVDVLSRFEIGFRFDL